jgi:chromosome segregation ATPase
MSDQNEMLALSLIKTIDELKAELTQVKADREGMRKEMEQLKGDLEEKRMDPPDVNELQTQLTLLTGELWGMRERAEKAEKRASELEVDNTSIRMALEKSIATVFGFKNTGKQGE